MFSVAVAAKDIPAASCLTFRPKRSDRGHSWQPRACFTWKKFICEFPNNAHDKEDAEDAEQSDFVSAPVCITLDDNNQSGDDSSEIVTNGNPSSVMKPTNCFRFIRSQRNRNDSRQFCQDSLNATLANFSDLMQNESAVVDKLEVLFW